VCIFELARGMEKDRGWCTCHLEWILPEVRSVGFKVIYDRFWWIVSLWRSVIEAYSLYFQGEK